MQSLFYFVSEANKRETQRDPEHGRYFKATCRIMSKNWLPGVVVSLSGIVSVFIFTPRVFGDWKSSGELARLKNIKIRTALS